MTGLGMDQIFIVIWLPLGVGSLSGGGVDLDVAAGGERTARSGEDDRFHIVVVLGLIERPEQASKDGPVDRVQHDRPVECDDGGASRRS